MCYFNEYIMKMFLFLCAREIVINEHLSTVCGCQNIKIGKGIKQADIRAEREEAPLVCDDRTQGKHLNRRLPLSCTT